MQCIRRNLMCTMPHEQHQKKPEGVSMISGLLDPDMLIVPNINVIKSNTHVRLGLEVKKNYVSATKADFAVKKTHKEEITFGDFRKYEKWVDERTLRSLKEDAMKCYQGSAILCRDEKQQQRI